MKVLSDDEREQAVQILGPVARYKRWIEAHTLRLNAAFLCHYEGGGFSGDGSPNDIIWLVERYFTAFGKLTMKPVELVREIRARRNVFLHRQRQGSQLQGTIMYRVACLSEHTELQFLKTFCQPAHEDVA